MFIFSSNKPVKWIQLSHTFLQHHLVYMSYTRTHTFLNTHILRCVYVLVAPFIFRPEAGYWVSLKVPDPFSFLLFRPSPTAPPTLFLSLSHTHTVPGARWWCGFLLVLWREAVLLAGRKASLCLTVSAFSPLSTADNYFPLQPSWQVGAAVVILHHAIWERNKGGKKTERMKE